MGIGAVPCCGSDASSTPTACAKPHFTVCGAWGVGREGWSRLQGPFNCQESQQVFWGHTGDLVSRTPSFPSPHSGEGTLRPGEAPGEQRRRDSSPGRAAWPANPAPPSFLLSSTDLGELGQGGARRGTASAPRGHLWVCGSVRLSCLKGARTGRGGSPGGRSLSGAVALGPPWPAGLPWRWPRSRAGRRGPGLSAGRWPFAASPAAASGVGPPATPVPPAHPPGRRPTPLAPRELRGARPVSHPRVPGRDRAGAGGFGAGPPGARAPPSTDHPPPLPHPSLLPHLPVLS